MSITAAIRAADSGLQAAGLRANVVATNVANAATPGYVRRSVNLGEVLLGQETVGVRNDGIARSEDAFLTQERQSLSGDLGQANVLASAFQTLSARLGDTNDGAGLFSAFSSLETALSNAVLEPESSAQANVVIDAANAVTSELNSLSDLAARQRAEADREIGTSVEIINTALQDIADLNVQIASTDRTSNRAAALIDERQRALDTVAEFLPIQTANRTAGRIDVFTAEGAVLVAGTAREIEFTPSINFGPGETIENGDLSGIRVGDTDLTPGSSSFAAISSGVLGGLFQLRDQELPQFNAQLDTIAADLVDRFSNDAIDPTKTPGAEGIFVLDPAPTAGNAAGRISVNAAIDPAQGGDLYRLRDGIGATTEGPPGNSATLSRLFDAFTEVRTIGENGLSGQFSATDLTAQFSSIVGQRRIRQDAILNTTSTQFSAVLDATQRQSGVDVDRELQDLIAIEQAYAANARVIQVADDLLSRLLEI